MIGLTERFERDDGVCVSQHARPASSDATLEVASCLASSRCQPFLPQSSPTNPESLGRHVQLYEDCVLDGILDILMVQYEPPVLGMAITLEEISWHEVDSCALAYGMAARQAVESILTPDRGMPNYEFIDSPSA